MQNRSDSGKVAATRTYEITVIAQPHTASPPYEMASPAAARTEQSSVASSAELRGYAAGGRLDYK